MAKQDKDKEQEKLVDDASTLPAPNVVGVERVVGGIFAKDLTEEMQNSYMEYAMSVIVSRALPDIRDGLKPVQRRILYAMELSGSRHTERHKKSAAHVGDTMKLFHPHGDASIYDALVRMAQDFSLRYPLIDGQGNFGSIDGDPPASMRYCVIGNTRVATPNGPVRIADIVTDARPESDNPIDLEVLDRNGRAVRATVLFHSGTHPTLTLRTHEGFSLTGSYNHPVLCLVDVMGVPMLLWKLLDEIKPGDHVAIRPEKSMALDQERVPVLANYLHSQATHSEREMVSRHNVDRVERRTQSGDEILARIMSDEIRTVAEPLVKAGFYYASVESVEPSGAQPVYSLRVASADHSFLTSGFVSHNTEARLSAITAELMADIDKETVDFEPSYDGSNMQPSVLPARFPNLLVNGASGIAVGMATNMPPHNMREVCAGVKLLLEDKEATPEDLGRVVKGPDFPTAGIIKGVQGIKSYQATGHGRIIVRARHIIEQAASGRERIIITELPYGVNKSALITNIARLVAEKRLEGISDLNDESDRDGMRIVIELRKDAAAFLVMNNLYKHTALQTTFGANMLALVKDGDRVHPVILSLKQMLQAFIDHRRDVIVRRTRFLLRKAEERQHILEGLLRVLGGIDVAIKLIRGAKNVEEARVALREKFDLDALQADAVLAMTLSKLTQTDRTKLEQEMTSVKAEIKELKIILASDKKVREMIAEEMDDIVKRFGDARKTEIERDEAKDLTEDELIPREEVVISLTRRGYVKRSGLGEFRSQTRGGAGARAAKPTAAVSADGSKEDDYAEHLLVSNTQSQILLFTQAGRVFQLRVNEIPNRDRSAQGTHVKNLVEMESGERITAIVERPEEAKNGFLVTVTRSGKVQRNKLSDYAQVRRTGMVAMSVLSGDEMAFATATTGRDDILLASEEGQAIRFKEDAVRPSGRGTQGVGGIRLKPSDKVVAAVATNGLGDLMIVSERGQGKRVSISEYPTKGRDGMGVVNMKTTPKTGRIAGVRVSNGQEDVLLITASGIVLRTKSSEISKQGRPAQGVSVMRVADGDRVVAIAPAD